MVIQGRVLEAEVVHREGHVLCQEVPREDTQDQHREVRGEAFPEAHVGPVLDLVADLANPSLNKSQSLHTRSVGFFM